MATSPRGADCPPSPSPSQLPPVPASPTYSYASTANPLSQYNLPLPPPPRTDAHAVLTKADLEHSQTAYSDLISSAKAYRIALAALSTAASTFGSALESCARLKEARADALLGAGSAAGGGAGGGGASLSNSFNAKGSSCTADTLLTAAGLQHLVANHHHILSETVYRSFEVPILHELDKWRGAVEDEEDGYARAVAAQSREIRRLEKEGMKLHRQRRRDVGKFRGHLVELTTKLDGLTALHGEHARTLLRESQETSARIVDASCSLVRAEVDIFESLARKGWTGGGLEEVLEKGVDLFANEEEAVVPVYRGVGGGVNGGGNGGNLGGGAEGGSVEGSKLFSILPPKSILADSGSDTIRAGRHNRTDSLLVETDRYQSLAGAVSDPGASRVKDRDTDSVFSEFNRSRGVVRPFSPQPQPLQLNPEDLVGVLDRNRNNDDDEEVSPSDEGTTLLGNQSGLSSHLSRNQRGEGSCESEGKGQGRREGCDVYDEEDDEEAHPWRNEKGIISKARDDGGADEEDGQAGDDTITSLTLPSPQEQQQPEQPQPIYGRETRKGSSWTAVARDTDDEDAHDGEGSGGKQ